MSETMIKVNGAELCTESFGKPTNPAVLLIMGATASMIWWDEAFCRRLADKGRYVIRYDNRDVGRSTAYEPGRPPYSIEDLADDAAGILAAYGINHAHIVGVSLGGMIAQILALRYPSRVLTLTMMASTVFGPDNPHLPSISKQVMDYHLKGSAVNWSDKEAAVSYLAGLWRLMSGSKHQFDEKRAHNLATEEARRANNLLSMFNHALLKGGEAYFGKISEIKAPALVVHGTEDPVLPYAHGVALANEIPNAVFMPLEGRGHELHAADWDTVIDAILHHSAVA